MFRNPVYEKEIRSTYRSVRILAIIVIFNIILALVGISRLSYIVNDMHFNGSAEYSAMLQLYIMIATIEFLLLVLIIPGQTAAAISGERERRTLDAMLSTNITPAALILGKLMASLTTTFLFITSSLPVLSLVFIYGGIQVSDLALLLGYMLFSAIYIGSSSICFSSYFRHTTTSTIISYGFVLFLFIGTLFLNEFPTLFSETVTPTFQTSLSPASYCLILNPAITFYYIMNRQAGNPDILLELLHYPKFYDSNLIIEHWIQFSIGIQFLIILLFLFFATRHLKNNFYTGKY